MLVLRRRRLAASVHYMRGSNLFFLIRGAHLLTTFNSCFFFIFCFMSFYSSVLFGLGVSGWFCLVLV